MSDENVSEIRELRLRYSVEVRENDKRLAHEAIVDPFITARIRPRGWRVAWAVLRRRYHVEVTLNGDRDRIEAEKAA